MEKLNLLKDYLAAYLQATNRIRQRGDDITYVDLFAGPGLVQNRETGEISDGSPLTAIKLDPGFTRFFFVDTDREDVGALQSWTGRLGLGDEAEVIRGDCNDVITEIVQKISRRGSAFVFLDPPSPILKWNTVVQLSKMTMRPSRNKPELFILFPYDMGLARMLPRDQAPELMWGEKTEEQISDLMPDPVRWRIVYEQWRRGGLQTQEKRRRFKYLYWAGLRGIGYEYVLGPRTISSPNGRPLYDLFFCSDHPVGRNIMAHVMRPPTLFNQQLALIQEDPPYEFKDNEMWYVGLS